MKSSHLRIFAVLAIVLFGVSQLAAQSTLSVQGVLQKTTGMAVEDGDYAITFRLYTTESGGTAVWSETQSDVEVVGGVYGVQLGSVTPLNIPFDQVYYLGLTVSGGTEHFPRTKLTAAPYALSLLGQDNKFPSTGMVQMSALATGTETTTATSYTVGDNDHVIYLDHTANQNVTLPAATAANAGRQLLLVNKEAVAKTLTASDYVDVTTGATSTSIPANSVIELQSDGSVWRQTGVSVQAAAQKVYVYCTPKLNQAVPANTNHSVAFTEVSDAQNCFNTTTFTAPRAGIYRASCDLVTSAANFSNYNGSTLNYHYAGVTTSGPTGRYYDGGYETPNTNIANLSFSIDVPMAQGQTFVVTSYHSPQVGTLHINPRGFLTIVEN